MRYLILSTAIAALLTTSACATKTYGRQGGLTPVESQSMTCREIELEVARTSGFIQHVNKESEFSGRDVLAILGDFGIGNALEKSAALESANSRLQQLQALSVAKRCAGYGSTLGNRG